MRALSLLLCAILLLSGCLAPASGPAAQDPTDTASPRSTRQPGIVPPVEPPAAGEGDGDEGDDDAEAAPEGGQPPPGPEQRENQPPAISAFTASIAAGSPPIDVTFEFTLMDPDDDSLAWRLSFGDLADDAFGFGTAAAITHLYRADGAYNVTLEATDGRHDPVQKALKVTMTKGLGTVTVSEEVLTDCAAACENCDQAVTSSCLCDPDPAQLTQVCQCRGPPDVLVGPITGQNFTPVEDACTIAGIDPMEASGGPGARACASFAGGESAKGTDCAWFAIPESAIRRPYVVVSGAGNPNIEFWSGCSATASRVGSQRNPGNEHDTAMPPGTKCLVAYEASFAPGGTTITLTYG